MTYCVRTFHDYPTGGAARAQRPTPSCVLIISSSEIPAYWPACQLYTCTFLSLHCTCSSWRALLHFSPSTMTRPDAMRCDEHQHHAYKSDAFSNFISEGRAVRTQRGRGGGNGLLTYYSTISVSVFELPSPRLGALLTDCKGSASAVSSKFCAC